MCSTTTSEYYEPTVETVKLTPELSGPMDREPAAPRSYVGDNYKLSQPHPLSNNEISNAAHIPSSWLEPTDGSPQYACPDNGYMQSLQTANPQQHYYTPKDDLLPYSSLHQQQSGYYNTFRATPSADGTYTNNYYDYPSQGVAEHGYINYLDKNAPPMLSNTNDGTFPSQKFSTQVSKVSQNAAASDVQLQDKHQLKRGKDSALPEDVVDFLNPKTITNFEVSGNPIDTGLRQLNLLENSSSESFFQNQQQEPRVSKSRYTAEENLFILKAREEPYKIPWWLMPLAASNAFSEGNGRNGRNMQVHYSQNINPRLSNMSQLSEDKKRCLGEVVREKIDIFYSGVLEEFKRIEAFNMDLPKDMVAAYMKTKMKSSRKKLQESLEKARSLKRKNKKPKSRKRR